MEKTDEVPMYRVPKRYIMTLACFSGLFISYAVRICINVAASKVKEGSEDVETMYTEYKWEDSEQVQLRAIVLVARSVDLI